MADDEFEALKADIAANGLREPIWLHPDGRILDGRNRYRACCDLGLVPEYKTWDGNGSLAAFVVSLNLHRRHLSSSQRAMIALDVLPMMEEEARERKVVAAETARELVAVKRHPDIEALLAIPAVRENIRRVQERQEKLKSKRRVYFMRDEESIKVGISSYADGRLLSLRTARPDIELLGTVAWYPGAESLISKKLAAHKIGGEWYSASDEVMAFIHKWLSDENCLVKELTEQQNEGKAAARAAAITHTNRQYVADAKKIKEEAPDLVEVVKNGGLSLPQAKQEMSRRKQLNRIAQTANAEAGPPQGRYDVVVIDPPWPMNKIKRDARPNQVMLDYPTMSEDELAALEIPCADNCHVWLWTTHKFLFMAQRLLDAWKLKYVCTFVWHKPGGFQPYGLPQFNCEMALYARRGSPVFVDTKGFNTCFDAPRGKHSEKPEEFYDMVRRVTAGKRLDMFARRRIQGFDAWGKEAPDA
jgi:N6-adenosine-specific RNA methylase IME4